MNPRTIDTKYEGKTSNDEKAELHIPMRALWQSETTAYYTALNEHADKPIEEKNVLQYGVRLDAVASWASSMPFVRTFPKDADKQILYTDKPLAEKGTAEDAIKEHFKDASPQNDWTLQHFIDAVITESVSLSPVF